MNYETANIQSVVENNIVSVALMNIQPSSYNPRKHFDEVSLAELAESIRQQGVLQPIGVRPIADTDRFEIVFGERRYRAALMAELTEISAVILHVSDETAAEMAVTENLQRKDVTPIEEANAYQKLMESGRYDVQSLAEQFGKNENYIRTRLKFVSLIPEIAELLEKDEITISVASEICRYGTDIQKEVYYKHLKDSDSMLYDCWRGLKAAEVAKFIERDFTTDLSRYAFDKTLCASCPHNTNNMMLFCEGGCGNERFLSRGESRAVRGTIPLRIAMLPRFQQQHDCGGTPYRYGVRGRAPKYLCHAIPRNAGSSRKGRIRHYRGIRGGIQGVRAGFQQLYGKMQVNP